MAEFRHEDIPGSPPDPADYSIAKEVARQARNVACNLWSKHPKWAGVKGSAQDRAVQWGDALMRDMCKKSPSPPPPQRTQPFTGGQCACASYTVVFRRIRKDGGTDPTSTVGLTGKIRGADLSGRDAQGRRLFTIKHQSCVTGTPVDVSSFFGVVTEEVYSGIQIVSITRNGGLPDNCGNPPPDFPPPFNEDPLPGDLVKPYVPPNSTDPGTTWNIGVPFIFIDANANVNVDVGGVTVKFDLGGVTLNYNRSGGDGTPGSGSSPPPDLSGLEQKIEQAKNAAEQAKNAAEQAKKVAEDRSNNDGDDPQNDPNKQEKEPKNEDDPKEEDGIERLLAVQVELLSMPSNRRTQDGGDAPDVNYAGWFEFKTKGTPHPRVPIHFERNYYIAPVGADGYAYTVYNGFTARAIVITAKATQ